MKNDHDLRELRNLMRNVLHRAKKDRDFKPFLYPVKKEDAGDYLP